MNETPSDVLNHPRAVLWDLDGTIIDSEEYWIVAEKELVESFGGSWSHADGLTLVGNGLPFTAEILQQQGVDLSIEEIIQRLSSRVIEQLNVAIPWRPGAIGLIEQFAGAGIPQAIVTMSIERMASTVAQSIPHSHISHIVAGDHVTRSKPDPEPYLLAAQRIDVNIAQCVAFEDSPAGCTSALKAGAFTVGVENLISLDDVGVDYLLTTLAGVDMEEISQAFSQRQVRTT